MHTSTLFYPVDSVTRNVVASFGFSFLPPFLLGSVRGRALNFLVTLNGIALEAGRDTPAPTTTVCMYCAGGKRECLANRHKVNESTHRRRGRKVGGRQALVLQAVSTRNQVIQPRRG